MGEAAELAAKVFLAFSNEPDLFSTDGVRDKWIFSTDTVRAGLVTLVVRACVAMA